MEVGDKILANNYELREKLNASADYELWAALDIFSGPALIKIWPFGGGRPDDTLRAAWNLELRNLLRLSSSPDADSRILIVRRAGIDYSKRSFVLVLSSPGTTPFDKILKDRHNVYWLRNTNETTARCNLWRGIRNLALGLQQLHQHQMLHRNIVPSSLIVDRDEGPESMRLGGFEWTIRLGATLDSISTVMPVGVNSDAPHSFESDWLALGLLISTILISSNDFYCPNTGLHQLCEYIKRSNFLVESERQLLIRMLDPSPIARLNRPIDILNRMDEIISILDRAPRIQPNAYLGLVVLLGPARELTRSIIESEPKINPVDVEAQRQFIENDLRDAKLVTWPSDIRRTYVLIGNRLSYLIREHSDQSRSSNNWSLAFCSKDAAVRYIPDSEVKELPIGLTIRVFTTARQNEPTVRRDALSWNYFLPVVERRSEARERQRRFHDFFRITNQIELLFRDAELFPYEVVSRLIEGENDIIIVREGERKRDCLEYATPQDGLLGFLENVTAAEDKRGADLVYLGPEEALAITPLKDTQYWRIRKLDRDNKAVHLVRSRQPFVVPDKGFLRTYGMFGQISLIKRRKQAIDRLQYHNYLLEALQNPYFLYVDTGELQLPNKIDRNKVDGAKATALNHLWRTRPIYALQGPPGTGKTTLVANLLGQIFTDDPVAQVLVSAQAHAAVDVLREKVNEDIFRDLPDEQQPLSIRLPRGRDDIQDNDPDSLSMVTLRLLERCEAKLSTEGTISTQWGEVVHEAIMGLKRGDLEGSAGDIRELVRRAASITYSTTTAGSLEELANTRQTYDWSLIEEAGKAHGFDLALPLQTGHRWLLIGDHKQLPAYKFDSFRDALIDLDRTIDLLMRLPERAGGLVDTELLHNWKPKNTMASIDRTKQRDIWVRWLKTFKTLFEICEDGAVNNTGVTTTPLSSMLSQQHRMHATIGDLISHAYYDGSLESRSENKEHCFMYPLEIVSKSLVWVNVPTVISNGTEGFYTSQVEVDAIVNFINSLQINTQGDELPKLYKLAVLSPYRLQVHKLARELRDVYTYRPSWLEAQALDEGVAHTVDSFQGDQADVVFVSLVRNNQEATIQKAFGFLKEDSRMNVLFSRAERLLVLVGNWHFFKSKLHGIPADPNQPFGRFKCALDYIERCMNDGRAAMISAADLEVQ